MSRLAARFAQLKAAGKTALIPYLTAGDPQPDATLQFMHALVAAGADIIELGVPFSDPMADGPVIQAACERALKHNVSLADVLDIVATFRDTNQETPIVLMGYTNPIEIMGYAQFAERAATAGVDGVITVDLPPEEAAVLLEHFKAAELDPVFLLSPTSTAERIQKISTVGSGFIYYVSLKGVTGASTLNLAEVASKLAQVRELTSLPLGVGFGIKDADTAKQVGDLADAVVVGSAVIRHIEQHTEQPTAAVEAIGELISTMRSALDEKVAG